MGKTNTTISLTSELYDLVKKQKRGFLSHFIEQQLSAYFELNKEDFEYLKSLERLQEEKAKVSAELYILREKEKQLEEEKLKKKAEAEKWREV